MWSEEKRVVLVGELFYDGKEAGGRVTADSYAELLGKARERADKLKILYPDESKWRLTCTLEHR